MGGRSPHWDPFTILLYSLSAKPPHIILVFILVIHPYTYGLTQKVFGRFLGQIADASVCPPQPAA